ncbi:MAG: tetratricopeptide repeat protein [Gemmatimonadales bacterium]
MTDPTPSTGFPSNDPEQLPLGAFRGVPALPADEGASAAGETDVLLVVREPPVCGEWSFDLSEQDEARAGATMVAPAAAAPIPPAPLMRQLRTPPIAQRSLTPPTPLPALDELQSIHAAHPGDAKTAITLSHAFDKRGNIERALGVLQRAIDAGADGVALRCARAKLLSGRLRYDDAEMELRRAAKLRPDDAEVLLQQGILACRRAKWRDAVEPLQKVAKLDSGSGQAHFYLGEALNKLDRLDDALLAFEHAATLEPENYRALKGVGIVLDRLGRPADAAVFYRRARDAQGG